MAFTLNSPNQLHITSHDPRSSNKQAFLKIDCSRPSPRHEFNESLGEACPWELVPTRWVPAACVPGELGAQCCVAEVTGPHECIVQGGLQAGISLTKAQIQQVMASFNISAPERGSGANRGVVKKDLLAAVLAHFFPEMTEEERAALLKKMGCGTTKAKDDPEAETPTELLDLVALLSPEEKPHFDKLIQEAVNSMEAA